MALSRSAQPVRPSASDQGGQAIFEYIIVLSAVVLFFLLLKRAIVGLDINDRLTGHLGKGFKHAYQFGHPQTIGPDESGGPKLHPRFQDRGNFRIFFNPQR
ncbi:MAG: hypothetical protein AB7F66_07345 [Bacteriovoracia bacterium]